MPANQKFVWDFFFTVISPFLTICNLLFQNKLFSLGKHNISQCYLSFLIDKDSQHCDMSQQIATLQQYTKTHKQTKKLCLNVKQMKKERANKNKGGGKNSIYTAEQQAKINAFQCAICKQTFMSTAREETFRTHVSTKHDGKFTFQQCFPTFKK